MNRFSSAQLIISLSLIFTMIGLGYLYYKHTKQQEAEALAKIPKPKVSTYKSTLVPEMIEVAGGTFQMGNDNGESDEKPAHSVTLNGFKIGKYEVTLEQFQAFVGATELEPQRAGFFPELVDRKKEREEKKKQTFDAPNYPIQKVTWVDAIRYCNWLSQKEGLQPCYTIENEGFTVLWDQKANGYRLPTEAEWEFAARGGTQSKGYRFSGSDSVESVASMKKTSGGKMEVVGLYQPNQLGIYDMSGSVWEWVWDRYRDDYYKQSPQENPTGAPTGLERVSRGGCFLDVKQYLTVYNRMKRDYTAFSTNLGFRIAQNSKHK